MSTELAFGGIAMAVAVLSFALTLWRSSREVSRQRVEDIEADVLRLRADLLVCEQERTTLRRENFDLMRELRDKA